MSSFKIFSEKVSKTQQQQKSIDVEFIIPIIPEHYSSSKKTFFWRNKHWKSLVEQDGIKIPGNIYEKVHFYVTIVFSIK